jgi:hypothetical protein
MSYNINEFRLTATVMGYDAEGLQGKCNHRLFVCVKGYDKDLLINLDKNCSMPPNMELERGDVVLIGGHIEFNLDATDLIATSIS